MIKYIDLFCGLGGIRLGFVQALKALGMRGQCVFSSDIKKTAAKTYRLNFPHANLHGDIKRVDPPSIPDFDYLLGGFPCQSFSTAGKQLGFKDTRGTLFFNIANILRVKQPKGFLLENVPYLLRHDYGKTFYVIKRVLLQLGYTVRYCVLNGADFGVAQKRKRLYIIGKKSSEPTCKRIQIPSCQHANVQSIIETNVPPKVDHFSKCLFKHYSLSQVIGKRIRNNRSTSYNLHSWDFDLSGKTTECERKLLDEIIPECRKHKWAKQYGIKWSDGMPLTEAMINTFYPFPNLSYLLYDLTQKHYLKYTFPKQTLHHRRQYVKTVPKGYRIVAGALAFEYNKILDPQGQTPTLTATDMSKLAVPVKNGIRPLTPREGLRLFGFPERYQLPHLTRNQDYDLIGNTVCVPVIKAVAEYLLRR